MKSTGEQIEILRAVVVLAAADGVIAPSEKGLMQRLAKRIGVGEASLNAMIARAKEDSSVREELFRRNMSQPEKVMELLVAVARIDGEISSEEREVLVQIMGSLEIPVERFSDIYQKGIERADKIRDNFSG